MVDEEDYGEGEGGYGEGEEGYGEGEVEYEGEDQYAVVEKEKEDLFHMDRFDPDAEEEEGDVEDKVPLKDETNETGEGLKVDGDKTEEEPKKKRRKRSKKKLKGGGEGAEGFTVLGDSTDSQRRKVARVLPNWLANPDIVQVE